MVLAMAIWTGHGRSGSTASRQCAELTVPKKAFTVSRETAKAGGTLPEAEVTWTRFVEHSPLRFPYWGAGFGLEELRCIHVSCQVQ